MILKDIIKGAGYQEQQEIESFFSHKNRFEKLNILWYPSAGNDYRNIADFLNYGMQGKVPEQDIFIHTDYMPEWVDLTPGVKYDENYIKIEIIETLELKINNFPGWNYYTDPFYVDFPELAYKTAKGFLVKLRIRKCYTVFEVNVLYLFLENHNFLDLILRQILLHPEKEISVNVLKVTEGIAWGGVRKGRSIANSVIRYMSVLNSDFIIMDQSNFSNNTAILNCPPANATGLRNYSLTPMNDIHISGIFFKVRFMNDLLNEQRESWIIQKILY
jgi:hypothetical protein